MLAEGSWSTVWAAGCVDRGGGGGIGDSDGKMRLDGTLAVGCDMVLAAEGSSTVDVRIVAPTAVTMRPPAMRARWLREKWPTSLELACGCGRRA